jgi:predicted transcriptional regulator YheO
MEKDVLMNPLLRNYVPLVRFLGEVIPESEVVLHDLGDLEHSVVAISERRLTERGLGSSITDFALVLLKNLDYRKRDFVTNYVGRSPDGTRTFRSSTFFIKDENGEAAGMLCVNVDITGIREASETLGRLLMDERMFALEQGEVAHESYARTGGDLLGSLIEETKAQFPQDAGELTAQEKRQFVAYLSHKGGFLLKGAVSRAAAELRVSDQTIYRYLKDNQA